MSSTRDQLPFPGDEVECTVRDEKNTPGLAWIYFTSGKRVEVRLWCEAQKEESPHDEQEGQSD